MIDLHCHLLPGIDDGPGTLDEALELARAFVRAGITTAVATPHVSWTFQNESAGIAAAAEQLRARLRADEVALEVREGAEVALTRSADLPEQELARLGLGGGRWLLAEPPLGAAVASGIAETVEMLAERGHRILLAHPERCRAFHREPRVLAGLARKGVLMSLTASSFEGRFGPPARRFAVAMADEGLVHNVVSDAHDPLRRPPEISAGLAAGGLEPLAGWLTELVPAAILADAEIPPRPSWAATPSRVSARLGLRGRRTARGLRG